MRSLRALVPMLALAGVASAHPMELEIVSRADGEESVVALRAPASRTVLLPAGTFTMGSSAEEVGRVLSSCKRAPVGGLSGSPPCVERSFAIEREPHEVRLSSFRLDRTEVTFAAHSRCVEAGRCSMPPYDEGGERFARSDFPVVLVTWEDASRYCRFVGGRLPTEAEWERAARGLRGRRYPWGEIFDPGRANGGAFSLDRHDPNDGFWELAPVGSFSSGRTPEGISDLAGNVAEWVEDGLEEGENAVYSPSPVENPRRNRGLYRIVRGGGFRSPPTMLRNAARQLIPATTRAPDIGFRCAYDAR